MRFIISKLLHGAKYVSCYSTQVFEHIIRDGYRAFGTDASSFVESHIRTTIQQLCLQFYTHTHTHTRARARVYPKVSGLSR
jgi:hypothetical protein